MVIAAPADKQPIPSAAITLDAPKTGEYFPNPEIAVADANYTVLATIWDPKENADGIAAPSTPYTATVMLDPKEGYVFTDDTEVELSGDIATAKSSTKIDGIILNITIEFPETAADAKAATPFFEPEAGEVEANTEVEIDCNTPDADIYYTTDGSKLTTESQPYLPYEPINQPFLQASTNVQQYLHLIPILELFSVLKNWK